jgi:predicted NUDIX family NTP pyrophosphohydrolase
MLRLVVLLLLLANGLYFAWGGGHLATLGFAPAQQSEPQRLQSQIKPEAIRLLNANEAQRLEQLAAAPAPKAAECLQSTLLTSAQASDVREKLNDLPAGSWSLGEARETARWIIYMGKYANAEAMAKKKTELREIGVRYESLKNTSLEIGFSLGAFASQQEANAQMSELAKRGVRTAKVVQESPERTGQVLKFPAVDDVLKGPVDALKTQLGAASLVACKV